ncbi:hypothetical protein [Glaciecola sp. MF2-115]|uniref:hypothetical protein n=1 Tax=Glaciecola sp. MF2-115 TaxID=3384827 RepID=UPI0039A36C7B
MDIVFVAVMILLGIICLAPAWVILSMPNVWFKSAVKMPAKSLTIFIFIISISFAWYINLELEMGAMSALVYLVVSTIVLSLLLLPAVYFYLKWRLADDNI